MQDIHYGINKYASIINRLSMIYFDQMLAPYQIAAGQQFFLLHINEHPGLGILEVAYDCDFDKGTTARAVQKLEEHGFVYRQVDEHDKRIQRLYISEWGKRMVPIIQKVLQDWEKILLDGISSEEIIASLAIVKRMSRNANQCIQERKRENHERNNDK